MRTFEDKPGVRSQVPLIVGLCGPSASGKTMSGLRLATGMREITGGEIFGIDTEAGRMCHYADRFKFRSVEFKSPFYPLDYLEAVKYCVSKGALNIIIDSVSHLWEGPGGVLESHESECERLMKQWKSTRDKVQMSAWQRPKQDLRRFINEILQLRINLVLCYRAKEKLKIVPGKQPVSLGWRPIAPEELMYEATVNFLLYPNCGGVPIWKPDEPGEKEVLKCPAQFQGLFLQDSRPLDEEHGRRMAEWARGGTLDLDAAIAEGLEAAKHGSQSLKIWFTGQPANIKATLKPTLDNEWKAIAKKADESPAPASVPDGDPEPDDDEEAKTRAGQMFPDEYRP